MVLDKNGQNQIKFSGLIITGDLPGLCGSEELSWKVGDPAASMEISGGTWPGFKMSDLNNDPETMWISGINKQIKIYLCKKI